MDRQGEANGHIFKILVARRLKKMSVSSALKI
jgi:hypothetical protein